MSSAAGGEARDWVDVQEQTRRRLRILREMLREQEARLERARLTQFARRERQMMAKLDEVLTDG